MKKLVFLLSVTLLFAAFCTPVLASDTAVTPELYLCKEADGTLTVKARIGIATTATSISAAEFAIGLNGLTCDEEVKTDASVKLPPVIDEESIQFTFGFVGGLSLSTTEKTDLFALSCTANSGVSVVEVTLDDATSVYPLEADPANLTPLSLTKDEANQKITGSLSTLPFCTAVCGNGLTEEGEQCDDGNTVNDDGCSSTCQTEQGTHGVPPTSVPPVVATVPANTVVGQYQPFDPTQTTVPTGSTLPVPGTTGTTQNGQAVSNSGQVLYGDEDIPDYAALHGAGIIEPQPVQFRDAAALGETGPRENAILAFIGAVILVAVVRFRKALL